MMTRRPNYSELEGELQRSEAKIVTMNSRWRELFSTTSVETQRLAAVVSDSIDAITLQDLAGNILAWNHGAEVIYGWSQDEAMSMNILDRIPDSQRAETLSVISRIIKGDQVSSFVGQRVTKDGQVLEVLLTLKGIRGIDQNVHFIASTERGDSQDALKIEHTSIDPLTKTKGVFGLLPICASCKNIRGPLGDWHQIEAYIRDRSNVTFTHTFCPGCITKLYGELPDNTIGSHSNSKQLDGVADKNS